MMREKTEAGIVETPTEEPQEAVHPLEDRFPHEIWLEHPDDAGSDGQRWSPQDHFDGEGSATRYLRADLASTVPAPPSVGNGVLREAMAIKNWWVLTWVGAPRPPTHPNPMKGERSFSTFGQAIDFMRRQPHDSRFAGLSHHREHIIDVTEGARTALPSEPPEMERSRAERAAEDERDRLLACADKQAGNVAGIDHRRDTASTAAEWLRQEGAMRPDDRIASRARSSGGRVGE